MEWVLCIIVAVLCMCIVRQCFYNRVFDKAIKKLIKEVERYSISDLFLNPRDLAELDIRDPRNSEFARYFKVVSYDHVHTASGWPRGTWMGANRFGDVVQRGTLYVKY